MLLGELSCILLLRNPNLIPGDVALFRDYYFEFDCNLIQYNKSAAEYDNALFYKLKNNNRFIYKNQEFSDSFATNSKGFRDEEVSLDSPSIVFVGDSYTLGWGANEHESFPSITEKITGLRGLNTGMSSYGTAREIAALSKVDLSAARFIVWQYCFNDFDENESLLSRGGRLEIQTQQEYEKTVTTHEWTVSYFPGKHFLTIIKLGGTRLLKKIIGKTKENDNSISVQKSILKKWAMHHAETFLKVLETSNIDWTNINVIVTELNPRNTKSLFIEALSERLRNTDKKTLIRSKIIPLNIMPLLNQKDYYILDVHLTRQGNLKVAEQLAKTINLLKSE